MISELFGSADLPASVADEPRVVTCPFSLDPSFDRAKIPDKPQHAAVGLVPATDRRFQEPPQLPRKPSNWGHQWHALVHASAHPRGVGDRDARPAPGGRQRTMSEGRKGGPVDGLRDAAEVRDGSHLAGSHCLHGRVALLQMPAQNTRDGAALGRRVGARSGVHDRDGVVLGHSQAAHHDTFHKGSPKHRQRYVNKLAGKQNIRDLGTLAQMRDTTARVTGCRLLYRVLSAENGLCSGARS